jgi:hypothetical protein
MGTITISIPDKLEKEINEFKGVDWSAFLRKAIELKAFELELEKSKRLKLLLLKAITSKSKLREEDADKFAIELGRKIKEERLEQLRERGLV